MLPPFSPNLLMYLIGLVDYVRKFFFPRRKMDVFLSVEAVIPVHNEGKTLRRTIESLLGQSVKLDQIIVVDDASTDDSNQVANSFSGLLVLRNDSRLGKALSVNRALKHINSDLVVVVDGDTILERHYISKLREEFAIKETAAASGFVIPSKESENTAIMRARVIEDLYSQSTLKRGQDFVKGMFVVSGCCAFYRVSVLREFLISDDTITEDLDLTWMLQRNGYRATFATAYAYTIEPNDLSSYRNQIKRWYIGFFQSLLKHGLGLFDSKPLTLTVSLILVECLFFTIFWIAIIGLAAASLIFGGEFNVFRTILYIFLGLDLFTVCFPALIRAYNLGYLTNFLLGIPTYYVLRLVNALVWWGSFAEWLFDWSPGWEE